MGEAAVDHLDHDRMWIHCQKCAVSTARRYNKRNVERPFLYRDLSIPLRRDEMKRDEMSR